MKLITRKIASGSKNTGTSKFIVMNYSEWLDIGKKAGFIKTQAKISNKALKKMEYVDGVLKDFGPDGTILIEDPEIIRMIKKVNGDDVSGKKLSREYIQSIRPDIFSLMKGTLKKEVLKRVENDDPDIPKDSVDFDLADKIRRSEEEEDSKVETYEGTLKDVSTIDPSSVSEITTEDIEEGLAEEKAIEQDSLELEKLINERKNKSKKDDVAGAVNPLDLFDEAVEVSSDGSSIIRDENVLSTIKEVTGDDYSGVYLSPDTVESIRTKMRDFFRPKISEENTLDEDESSDGDEAIDPDEEFLDQLPDESYDTSGDEDDDDLAPASPFPDSTESSPRV